MRTLFLLLALIAVALAMVHCSNGTAPTDAAGPVRTPAELTAGEKQTAASANRFGFELAQQIEASVAADSNYFFSPLSVSYALGMLLNGADGQTYAEILQTLQLEGMTGDEINQAYQGLLEVLLASDPSVVFELANSIWYDVPLPVEPTFIEVNQKYFEALVRGIDFSAIWAADTINEWIDVHTHGKITDMVDKPIGGQIVMFLINAIYFNGAWTLPFDTAQTFTVAFFRPDGDTVFCDMMHRDDSTVNFYAGDIFDAVDLPYGREGFAMMVILPHEDASVGDVVANMNEANWNVWRSGFTEQRVSVGIPRFKYGYADTLNAALKAMGMLQAFSCGADFSRMVTGGGVWVGRVKHKAVVQVDERGTEAAAVTVIEVELGMPATLFCNRPFLYLMYEKTTGTILFMGRVAEPVWNEDV